MERLTVRIPDLTCASCVPHIEQVMRQQSGVIWAIVNFAAEEAMVIYDPVDFHLSKFVQAVNQLGYKVIMNDPSTVLPPTKPVRPGRPSRVQHLVHMLHH